MNQINTGIRSILSHPLVYDTLQNIMGVRKIRQEFVNEFIRPVEGQRILDIGCGTAELLEFLPDNITYIGYDPSQDYINHAIKRQKGNREFHCGFYGYDEAKSHMPFDVVIASGVLHHMDDFQVAEMMRLVKDNLTEGGKLLTIDPVICSSQNPIARALISLDRGQNVRSQMQYTVLANTGFTQVKGQVRHRAWIPWTHWIMECSV